MALLLQLEGLRLLQAALQTVFQRPEAAQQLHFQVQQLFLALEVVGLLR